jgi:hypothetical protein
VETGRAELGDAQIEAAVVSANFSVYSPKRFPGMTGMSQEHLVFSYLRSMLMLLSMMDNI